MRPIQTFFLAAAVTALASCQSTAGMRSDSPEPETVAAAEDLDAALDARAEAQADAEAAAAEPVADPAPRASRATLERGTGEFFDREAAARSAPAPAGGDVTFNWEDVPVQVVIKAILGDLLGENYVIAPGVQGTVTFSTAKPINVAQARAVLEMILQQNNLAMVYKDGRYTILPIAQAIPGNLTPKLGALRNARGYEVRVVPLRFIAPTEMEKLLVPYVRQGAVIRADNARSMIVLAGNGADLQTYVDTIEIFDVNWLEGMSVGIFPLERVEAGTVVPELEKLFGEGAGTPLAGMFRFMPIERMNAVLVITPQPEYLEEAERWLAKLDRGGDGGGSQLFVYYVKNVKATDLAENLTEIFTGSTSSSSSSKPSTVGGVAPGLEPVEIRTVGTEASGKQRDSAVEAVARENRVPQGGVNVPGMPGTVLTPGGGEGISITESENIRISAIEESNALLIRASSGEYDSILAAIKRLDVVPLQVHVEVKILSVTLNDDLSLGVEWFFENKFSSSDTATFRRNRRNFEGSRDPNAPEGPNVWNSFAGTVGSGGITWTFVNTAAEALLSTLQSNGNAKVLSAPSLVVLNNKEASINVGTQLPVVSSFIGTGIAPVDPNTGVNSGLNQSFVQFRNTGITLKVTPRVNPGGLVFMEVSQEDSQPIGDAGPSGNQALSQRQITTEIAVQSGQSVLLGGLIRDTDSLNQSGLPGLSKIPFIGGLFGKTSKQKVREELLVLITPTVVGSAQSAEDLTNEYRSRFRGLQPLLEKSDRTMPPMGGEIPSPNPPD